jgi:hypothetical protein
METRQTAFNTEFNHHFKHHFNFQTYKLQSKSMLHVRIDPAFLLGLVFASAAVIQELIVCVDGHRHSCR